MTRIQPESLFVVSGGARGIAAQCVIGLARRYHCRFLLLGRTQLQSEPDWAAGIDGDAELKARIAEERRHAGESPTPRDIHGAVNAIRHSREIRQTLTQLTAAGSTAEYVTADVAEGSALEAAVKPVLKRLGAVNGLVHAAGAISDKLIAHKALTDFEAVYATKVLGLRNLLRLIRPDQLNWLVLFSSAAGFFGNPGQADYAMANEILNRAGRRLKAVHPDCHVLSLNWGPWDAGMVTPELGRRFREAGIQVIPCASGVDAFLGALENEAPSAELLVGRPWRQMPPAPVSSGPWTIRRRLSTDLAPSVLDHVIGEHPVLPAVCAAGWLASAGEQLYPGFYFSTASNLRVLKGVVFNSELASDYFLQVQELRRGPDQVHYKAIVSSEAASRRERFHYTGECVLRQVLPDRPRFDGFDLQEDRNAVDGHSLYHEGLLFHGPTFQGIERVLNAAEERITLRCRLPAVTPAVQGQFPVRTYNPYLADVQLQSVLVWALMLRGVGGHPLHLESIELFATPPFDETVFVTTRIRRADATAIIGDSVMHDASGLVYMRHTGAELTPSAVADGLLVGAGT